MIKAYAAQEAKAKLEPFEYEEVVGENDVLVSVEVCGVCHSDIHLADGEWGEVFPLVPGHEVVGTVKQFGESVEGFEVGQRVGVGWQCDSCNDCEYCREEKETFCTKNKPTCMGHHGGFADELVANKRFVIPVPDVLDSATAAPLMCGGVTVYTPIDQYAKAGDHVAVVGIGGLGHLALQIAKAKGCKVTAISTSADKEEMARQFGADEFVLEPAVDSYDLILNTAHVVLPMDDYIKALRGDGTFVQLGVPTGPFCIEDITATFDGNKRIAGSGVGHPHKIKELLELAAEHNIAAEVQVMEMSEVNEAVDITRQNQARFRVVLKN